MSFDALQEVRIDVELLKKDVNNITALCSKMDIVIEKLISNHDKIINQVYDDMNTKKSETNADIKELHSRITTVDRSLSDKLELTERRIMDELKDLRQEMKEHNDKEQNDLKKIMEWKWMAAGGIVLIAYMLSLVKIDITKFF
jgi:DNA repair exonuclease SbcCD ATPase subunit